MRTHDEAYTSALDRPAFSNGTEWERWFAGWCCRCLHDKSARDDTGPGCPLVGVAMLGRTPAEWFEQSWGEHGPSLDDRYHCVEFRDEDDPGGYEPVPLPDPPGQVTLLPRDDLEGVRMLTRPEEVGSAHR